MKLYKLTDVNDQTYGGCQWGPGITHTAPGEGELCTAGWLHAYIGSEDDPEAGMLLAVLLNPIHGAFDPKTMHLWECDGVVGKTDLGLKVGCTSLTTLRRADMPLVTLAQMVAFGILATLEIYPEPSYRAWAAAWLDGTNRSVGEAYEAARYAAKAANAAYAAWEAYEAARYAANAANAAWYEAYEAKRHEAARYAAKAAYEAKRHEAARYAANAADTAEDALGLAALARRAMQYGA